MIERFALHGFTGGQTAFFGQPSFFGLPGARGTQSDVDVFEFDVDEFAARADTLQLQVAVVGNDVFEIPPEGALSVYGGHGHGLFADYHLAAFFDNDHVAADITAHPNTILPDNQVIVAPGQRSILHLGGALWGRRFTQRRSAFQTKFGVIEIFGFAVGAGDHRFAF
jgi:hypothetical protein